jgi:NADH-quinone oxidoreductase subunit K
MEITLFHYLVLGALLFTLGVMGIFLNRRNVIIILMCIELILLGTNITLVAFGRFAHNLEGEIFSLFVLATAAAEAAIGLAILVLFFRKRGTIETTDMQELKG